MDLIYGLVFIVVAVMVAISMTVLTLLAKPGKAKNYYFAFEFLIFVWCISQCMMMLAYDTQTMVISYGVGNTGLCFLGSLWYRFAAEYTKEDVHNPVLGKWFGKLWIPTLIISFVHWGAVAFNSMHHLYYRVFEVGNVQYGPMFYSNIFSIYVFACLGAVRLFVYMRHKKPDDKMAAALVLWAAIVPVIANVCRLSGLVGAKYDITSVGFGISAILLFRATLVHRFMDVELNRQLQVANVRLALSEERNRIAQQVHDTVGHTLTMLLSYMKLADISVEKGDKEEAKEYISQGRELCSNGIKELRESINQLRSEASYELVTQGVMQLANQVKEIPVEVTIRGEDKEKYSHLSKVVHDSLRESITNTLKYAQATRMDVVLNFKEKALDVIIGDDGKGCAKIEESNGTRGIRERVAKVGGTVSFITEAGGGFMTRIHLPVVEREEK